MTTPAAAVTVTIPNNPTNQTGSAASATQVNLSWTNSSGNVSGFQIYRWSGSTWAQIATVGPNVTTYTDSGRSPSTTYYYEMTAYNSAGASTPTSYVTVTTPATTVTGTTAAIALDASTQPDSQGRFLISTACVMPKITVKLTNLPSNTPANLVVTWTVVVDLPSGASLGGVHLTKSFTTNAGTTYTPNFPSLMGGNLTISAAFTVNGVNYRLSTANSTATAQLKILATNPTKAQIEALINSQPVPANWPSGSAYDYHSVLRKIANVESGYLQFYSSGTYQGYPMWNKGGDGGVGIMQVTKSSPVITDVWNWQTNVLDGVATFNDKLRIASTYPTTIQSYPQFTAAVKAYNASRIALGQPPLKSVVVPLWSSDPTERANDRVLDAIRCYNGAAGTDSIGTPILHEFELATTSSGLLDLTVNGSTLVGTAKWVRVDWQTRIAGMPNYVNAVLNTLDA